MWPVYALAALTVAYVVFRPMMRKKRPDPLERMPQVGLSQQRAVEREMSNLLVELSQMARQITAQLDTRAAKLELLIDEADKRIGELKRLGQRLDSPDVAEDEKVVEPAPVREPVDPRHQAVYALADAGRSAQAIADELGRPRGEVELILALRVR
jgi:hypothetical protein